MLLKIENVTKKFGGLFANTGVSIEIEEGQIVGFIGPNGAGKSTLFKSILGFNRIDEGEIFFCKKRISKLETYKISRLGIACTFQNAQIFPRLTLEESVLTGAYCHQHNKKQALSLAREMIGFVGLSGKENTLVTKLNILERKKAQLAVSLAIKPKLILLDELFAGLVQNEVNQMLQDINIVHKTLGITLFIIEHVLRVIMNLCPKIYVINYGQIISIGSPSQVTSDPKVIEAYLGVDYDLNKDK